MGLVTAAAHNITGVRKTMLTCFVSNPRGRRFYERLGFDTDVTSPQPRTLRGGREAVPDYVILSRPADGEWGSLIEDGVKGSDKTASRRERT
jgi:RimJ/RimL family protein N-acetyltransferase